MTMAAGHRSFQSKGVIMPSLAAMATVVLGSGDERRVGQAKRPQGLPREGWTRRLVGADVPSAPTKMERGAEVLPIRPLQFDAHGQQARSIDFFEVGEGEVVTSLFFVRPRGADWDE